MRTESLLDSATTARQMIAAERDDSAAAGRVRAQIESTAIGLDSVAGAAPTPMARDAAAATAEALRNVGFAQEAGQLLRESATAPTAEQLTDASATWRARMIDLDTALRNLELQLDRMK